MYHERSMWAGKYSFNNYQPIFSRKMSSSFSAYHDRNASAAQNYSQVIVFRSPSKWRMHFEASKNSNKLMVIYFTATWCGPCRHMEPVLDDLAAKYTNVEFIKIDVDELFDVAEEFKVQTMPTMILMKKGTQVDKIVGAKKEELQMKVQKHSLSF